jgi:hypothetical protein
MNVMRVHDDPRVAARMLPDQHAVKMPTEAAQILSTAAHLRGLDTTGLYKPTHVAHPCVRQAASSDPYAAWAAAHGFALVGEWRWRSGDPTKHRKAEAMLMRVCARLGVDPLNPAAWADAPPAVAVADDLRGLPPVEAYRAWVRRKHVLWATRTDKRRAPARWTRRIPPRWLGSAVQYAAIR